MLPSISISPAEFEARAARLLDHIRSSNLSGVVLFDNYYILYFTGFAFIPTERPIAFAMNGRGEKAMFVPRLELEHAQAQTGFARVDHYVEYPDDPHPMAALKRTLADMGIGGQIGRNAAIPHALANNIIFQEGDVLVTGAGAPVWGYNSELERTMVVGRPSDEQRRMFEHMKAAQEVAFAALRPGAACADVDRA